ncbi:MAG: hypothetical protein FADNKDHG_01471 [Holosporales bacterium]
MILKVVITENFIAHVYNKHGLFIRFKVLEKGQEYYVYNIDNHNHILYIMITINDEDLLCKLYHEDAHHIDIKLCKKSK